MATLISDHHAKKVMPMSLMMFAAPSFSTCTRVASWHMERYKTTAEYLAELDASQLHRLLEVYRPDFDMFGYSPTDY